MEGEEVKFKTKPQAVMFREEISQLTEKSVVGRFYFRSSCSELSRRELILFVQEYPARGKPFRPERAGKYLHSPDFSNKTFLKTVEGSIVLRSTIAWLPYYFEVEHAQFSIL